jgi:GNAT superfamily N-acetyltransferase
MGAPPYAPDRNEVTPATYHVSVEPSPSTLWRLAGDAITVILRAAPGFEARLTPHAALALSGAPAADLNCAVVHGGPDPASSLRDFMGRVYERDLPVIVILAEEVAEAMAPAAGELGLEPAGRMPLMLRGAQAAGPGSARFHVSRVTSAADCEVAVALTAAAFNLAPDAVAAAMPSTAYEGMGLDYFLARDDDGNAVSSGATTRHGSIVGVWDMATAPDHQRKGAGRALLDHVLAYHLERGAAHFFLGATKAGQPLYERVGFRTIAQAAVWVRGHSTQTLPKDTDA